MVSPIGNTVDEFWAGLKEGKSGVSKITRFDASRHTAQIAGEVKNFDPAAYMDRKELRRMDRYTHYAMAAAKMAVEDSGLKIEGEFAERVGVIIASGIGGTETWEAQHQKLLESGPDKVSPFFVPMMISDIAAGYVSIAHGAKGPNYATVSACASGGHAIGEALKSIQTGDSDAMICGGAEAPITPLALAGFCALRALSLRNDDPEHASRPFDKDRDGFVMGEGAGVVMLEEYEHAKKRGAKIYAEVKGYGMSGDAYHITAPASDGDGGFRAMTNALKNAKMNLEDIDYINAHGTSTPLGDEIELGAVKRLFGAHAYKLTMSSTKSAIGHLLGAAGAVEAVYSIMAIKTGIIPPTLNLHNPSESCDIDLAPLKAKERKVDVALSNSFGFGGTNASLIFTKPR